MTRVKIDCDAINDKDSFHDVFARAMGFPSFYGRNMDAWVDCMSYVDDPGGGMSKVVCEKGSFAVLELEHVKEFKKRCPELYANVVECSAFVNFRNLAAGAQPLIMLSFSE